MLEFDLEWATHRFGKCQRCLKRTTVYDFQAWICAECLGDTLARVLISSCYRAAMCVMDDGCPFAPGCRIGYTEEA
jgi:hypothetical protein